MIESLRDLRRQQIVAAARAIVAEGSLEQLTISTLEARLSFTRGTITHHFANKDEIVAAVLESAIAEIDAAARAELGQSERWEDKVRAMLRAHVRGFVEHPEAARVLISFWGQIPRGGAAARANARLYAGYREQAAKVLRAGARAGEIAPTSVDALAALMVGIVIGVATQAYFEPDAIDVEAVLREAEETVVARVRRRTPEPSKRRRSRSA